MKYLFDTDHISILQRRGNPKHAALVSRLLLVDQLDVAFSVVSFHEQFLGAHTFLNRAEKPADLVRGYEMLDILLESYSSSQVLRFDDDASQTYEYLLTLKTRVGAMDLRIAAIGLSNQLTVVTANVRDFGKIPGLPIEDWTLGTL